MGKIAAVVVVCFGLADGNLKRKNSGVQQGVVVETVLIYILMHLYRVSPSSKPK